MLFCCSCCCCFFSFFYTVLLWLSLFSFFFFGFVFLFGENPLYFWLSVTSKSYYLFVCFCCNVYSTRRSMMMSLMVHCSSSALVFYYVQKLFASFEFKKKLQQRDEAESIRSHRMSELRPYLPGFHVPIYLCMKFHLTYTSDEMIYRSSRKFNGVFFTFWLCSCGPFSAIFSSICLTSTGLIFFRIFFCMNTYL